MHVKQIISFQVFPHLYLPLMTEGNLRTLRPWRMYLPTPSYFRNRSLMRQLDASGVGVKTLHTHQSSLEEIFVGLVHAPAQGHS